MPSWDDVGVVLLGSWPSQVNAWGPDAIQAYVDELGARGLTAEQAIVALRSSGERFPPAAGEIAAAARFDPSTPTFEEVRHLIEKAIKRHAQDALALDMLRTHHSSIAAFAERYGMGRLRMLPTSDPTWGEKHLRDLREAWERHVAASETRQVAVLASGRPDGLRQLDPLAALGRPLALAQGDESA